MRQFATPRLQALPESLLVFGRLPFRLHLPAPSLGIFVVHSLHIPCHIGVLFHHVPGHYLHHFFQELAASSLSQDPPNSRQVIVFMERPFMFGSSPRFALGVYQDGRSRWRRQLDTMLCTGEYISHIPIVGPGRSTGLYEQRWTSLYAGASVGRPTLAPIAAPPKIPMPVATSPPATVADLVSDDSAYRTADDRAGTLRPPGVLRLSISAGSTQQSCCGGPTTART